MRRAMGLAVLAALSSLWLPSSPVSNAQAPAAVTVVHRTQFAAVGPAVPFDVIMRVVEFEPGAWFAPHLHPGDSFATVLEGDWTSITRTDGAWAEAVTYGPGEAVLVPAWSVLQFGNLGTTSARLLVTMFQPKDVAETIFLPLESFHPGASRPRLVYGTAVEATGVSGPIDLYHTLAEVAPGAVFPAHFHPGLELALVLEGELVLTKETSTSLSAGQSAVNAPGEVHSGSNATDEMASFVSTHLIASGRPLTFVTE